MLARAIFDALSLQPVIMYMDILGKENAGELKAEKQPVRNSRKSTLKKQGKILPKALTTYISRENLIG